MEEFPSRVVGGPRFESEVSYMTDLSLGHTSEPPTPCTPSRPSLDPGWGVRKPDGVVRGPSFGQVGRYGRETTRRREWVQCEVCESKETPPTKLIKIRLIKSLEFDKRFRTWFVTRHYLDVFPDVCLWA